MTSEFTVAVHAIVFLNHKKTILASDVLADNVCTNPARIRKVMAKLKKAGLVVTKEGIDGGYYFNQDPNSVNLQQICEALDTKIVSSGWRSGNACLKCLIASGMADIMDEIYEDLDDACKKRLSQITIQNIDDKIFKSKPAL